MKVKQTIEGQRIDAEQWASRSRRLTGIVLLCALGSLAMLAIEASLFSAFFMGTACASAWFSIITSKQAEQRANELREAEAYAIQLAGMVADVIATELAKRGHEVDAIVMNQGGTIEFRRRSERTVH